jgi:hypothetical protein
MLQGKGNRNKKDMDRVTKIIGDAVTKNPYQTLANLAELVNSELGFKPSPLTIMRILAGLGKSANRITRWD